MSFHFTAAELAFAVPAGVVLGAVVSLVAQRSSTKTNIQAQQQLAETQRIWDKRATAYAEVTKVLVAIDRILALDGSFQPGKAKGFQKVEVVFDQFIVAVPELLLWGSEEIRGGFNDYTALFIDMHFKIKAVRPYIESIHRNDTSWAAHIPSHIGAMILEINEELRTIFDKSDDLIRQLATDLQSSRAVT